MHAIENRGESREPCATERVKERYFNSNGPWRGFNFHCGLRMPNESLFQSDIVAGKNECLNDLQLSRT